MKMAIVHYSILLRCATAFNMMDSRGLSMALLEHQMIKIYTLIVKSNISRRIWRYASIIVKHA